MHLQLQQQLKLNEIRSICARVARNLHKIIFKLS